MKKVKINTVEDYFALPQKERSFMGVYFYPESLRCPDIPTSVHENFNIRFPMEWKRFSNKIRKEYPIQGYFREYFFTVDNPLYFFFWKRLDDMRDIYYNLKRMIWPIAPRFRKVVPRWKYEDVCEIIREANFALILDFWHEEVVDGCVDWTSDEYHRNFYDWLKSSVEYIEKGRKMLLEDIDAAYELPDNYATVDSLERLLAARDEDILVRMIKERERFWT